MLSVIQLTEDNIKGFADKRIIQFYWLIRLIQFGYGLIENKMQNRSYFNSRKEYSRLELYSYSSCILDLKKKSFKHLLI